MSCDITSVGTRGAIGTTIGLQIEMLRAVRTFLDRDDFTAAQAVQTRINDTVTALVAIDVFPAAKPLS